MAVARPTPIALRLGDGRVLVLENDSVWERHVGADTVAAEVWNPGTGAWAATEGLNGARFDFAAVTLADGRVLATGGLNADEQSYSSTYIYDWRSGERPGRRSASWGSHGRLRRLLSFEMDESWSLAATSTSVRPLRSHPRCCSRRTARASPRLASRSADSPMSRPTTSVQRWRPRSSSTQPRDLVAHRLDDLRPVRCRCGDPVGRSGSHRGSESGPNNGVTVDDRAAATSEMLTPPPGGSPLPGSCRPSIERH